MSSILRSDQVEAVNHLKNGSILVGGVGSGKSRTALAYFYFKVCGGYIPIDELDKGFHKMTNPMDLYIITTAKKRDNKEWEEEADLFMISSIPGVDKINGVTMHVDSWNNISKYLDVHDAFFIFDEQRVVGYGEWARSFIKITRRNKWILLSATPGDQWTDYIPVFIANGFYKNKTDFMSQHCIMSHFTTFPRIERYIGTARLIRLRESILVDIDYFKKTTDHHIQVPVDYDKNSYLVIFKNRWNIYEDLPVENISQCCYLLRKVVNTDPSRITAMEELLAKNDRTIVFYNFDYELDILRDIVKRYNYTSGEWNGHVHNPIPDTDKWVYLVQYTAGAEGWNCTKTNVVIFYSENYSYKTMVQASGRIDRCDTKYTDLYYYHLKSKAPIDLAISAALKKKKKFNERSFLRF